MRRLLWLPALVLAPVGLLVTEANGLTCTSLAALSLSTLCVVAALGRWRAAAAVVLLDVCFVGARLVRPGATTVFSCVATACGDGAGWQRIIDEREATRAGLFLAHHLGAIRDGEFAAFDSLIDAQWATASGDWLKLANPLFMYSNRRRVEALRVRARVAGVRPCVVFLHGFGGLLSLYVRAIAEGTNGEFDIVAPALGPSGAWWSAEGQAVIAATLATLPADVDPARVYLVGLSNGGVGASAVLRNQPLARRFAGVVLLSGVGEASVVALRSPRVLVLSGTRDRRFDGTWVGTQVEKLRETGAAVTWRRWSVDHFLMLTHAHEWTRLFVEWANELSERAE